MEFEVCRDDGTSERVRADGYVPEGPLTTFFCVDPGRRVRFDAWSTRVLSVRTDRIVSVRADAPVAPGPPGISAASVRVESASATLCEESKATLR